MLYNSCNGECTVRDVRFPGFSTIKILDPTIKIHIKVQNTEDSTFIVIIDSVTDLKPMKDIYEV